MDLEINRQRFAIDVPADTPLLWVLREECALSGTKFSCGKGLCGACTVHINGQPMRSCVTPVSAAARSSITTIEGAANDPLLRLVQETWIEEDVVQCGYCQPGQIMAATALLRQNPKPDDNAIDAAMAGNLCRCGTYPRIRAAIHKAAAKLPLPKGAR